MQGQRDGAPSTSFARSRNLHPLRESVRENLCSLRRELYLECCFRPEFSEVSPYASFEFEQSRQRRAKRVSFELNM